MRRPDCISLKDDSRYQCEKHGVTTRDIAFGSIVIGNAMERTPHISVSIPEIAGAGRVRYFCLICYGEWIAANVPELKCVYDTEAK